MIKREGLIAVMGEIDPLLTRHHNEVNQDGLQLKTDWSAYMILEEAGMLELHIIRKGGVMVGYAVFVISPMLHYKGTLSAHCDVIYIEPEHRKGHLAMSLIRHCEQAMRDRGVVKIMWGVKVQHDWSKLLERAGYMAEEIILSKTLKEQ